MNEEVAVIIPVYNEGKVIKSVIDKVLKEYKYVVCINDGSSDNSREEILKTKAYFVDHPINMGQGAALQTGVEFARSLPVEYFVTYDADGQHRLEDVREMIRTIKRDKTDFVLGSRFLGKEAVNMPKMKRIILKMAIRFSNITSGVKLTDTHNGLRVFNRKVANSIQITLPDMAHASEILEIIYRNKYTYTEVPVVIEYTDYSRGKGQSIINAVNIAFDTLLRKVS
ncbi:glycosyltransferase family 2 protein [Candidatus Saccharibacteria bacterium]|jgi:glycosyltransferase, family 2|nr:glycosyltransferase family 2 protein [Candidatus Saccharibacteria bacterium]RKV95682.1 MAG: glycosyltransferase family 2 protein [Candidatus Saccharimonas sp.]